MDIKTAYCSFEYSILDQGSADIHEYEEWAGGRCADYDSLQFYSRDGNEWLAHQGDLVCKSTTTGLFFVIPKLLAKAMSII